MISQDSWEEAISYRSPEEEYAVESVRGCPGGQLGRTDDWDDSVLLPERWNAVGCPGGQLGGTDDWDVSVPQRGKTPSRAWAREGKANRECRPGASAGSRRVKTDEDYEAALLGTSVGAEELTDPLEQFANAGYITDVVNRVKSGKEATVFCCRAHPSTGHELVAAKVYTIGIGAHYRMSKIYADGRFRVYKPDSRQERAIKSGKQHGKEMVFADWVGQEYANLCAFHAAGADVPEPIHQCGSGILMDYIGDATRPAPTLVGATLTPEEAHRLFDQAMRNIRIFLAKDRVHGDLSPYNMLLWKDRLVVIDLPQVVHARWNDEAFNVLQRDIENILSFFSRRGVNASATELAVDLWTRYRRAQLTTD